MSLLPAGLSDRLVESVPNVSEGRRLDVVDRLATAIASVDGVHLLDRTSDASHNRSVFTIAGPADDVSEALERLVASAVREIDMDEHTGEHPRIGAVDVIPFVPLGSTTMADCIDLARESLRAHPEPAAAAEAYNVMACACCRGLANRCAPPLADPSPASANPGCVNSWTAMSGRGSSPTSTGSCG